MAYGCSQIGDLAAHLVAEPDEEILTREDKLQQKVSTII